MGEFNADTELLKLITMAGSVYCNNDGPVEREQSVAKARLQAEVDSLSAEQMNAVGMAAEKHNHTVKNYTSIFPGVEEPIQRLLGIDPRPGTKVIPELNSITHNVEAFTFSSHSLFCGNGQFESFPILKRNRF